MSGDGETIDLTPLSHTGIPVGESVEVQLSFDTVKLPGVLALIYSFEGTSADGRPVIGEVPVMKPPPKPTRANSVLVHDVATAERIRKALTLLQKDTVSQEELWQLERDGRLERAKDKP
jgi:hypothetical protein